MTTPARFYDSKQMLAIGEFFAGLQDLQKELEGDLAASSPDKPLYVFGMEIVIRHSDDYTVGRFGMDDFLYFEMTDEHYGEKEKS